ncbi:60S ribosomal protein L27 [Anaeramoeba flamelloides]|uniref:60S ribosomal protein L27 n=1 Tax=Anaeramoeba flamelloides TaxID=1746091 RepID=A0ABQ8Y912_9EUKA|nr:60S ribosomal protein L27 [Anaeramoeba flamelloides]
MSLSASIRTMNLEDRTEVNSLLEKKFENIQQMTWVRVKDPSHNKKIKNLILILTEFRIFTISKNSMKKYKISSNVHLFDLQKIIRHKFDHFEVHFQKSIPLDIYSDQTDDLIGTIYKVYSPLVYCFPERNFFEFQGDFKKKEVNFSLPLGGFEINYRAWCNYFERHVKEDLVSTINKEMIKKRDNKEKENGKEQKNGNENGKLKKDKRKDKGKGKGKGNKPKKKNNNKKTSTNPIKKPNKIRHKTQKQRKEFDFGLFKDNFPKSPKRYDFWPLCTSLKYNDYFTSITIDNFPSTNSLLSDFSAVVVSNRVLKKIKCTNMLISEGFDMIGKALYNNPTIPLSHLDFSGNTMSDRSIQYFAKGLQSMENGLRYFSLENNNLNQKSITTLLNTLVQNKNHHSIKYLNLSGNRFGKRGSIAFSDFCKETQGTENSLSSLLLKNCHLKIITIMNSLYHYFKNNKMKILDLSYNKFSKKDVISLQPFCQSIIQLNRLKLIQCSLKNDLVSLVLHSILTNDMLKKCVFEASRNKIGSQGGKDIGDVLKNNSKSNSLNGLILDDCELGSVGIGYVCYGVLLLDNLRKLSISRNLVKDNSIKSNDLYENIQKISSLFNHSNLLYLRIRGNNKYQISLNSQQSIVFFRPLAHIKKLKILDLTGNHFGAKVFENFCESINNPSCQLKSCLFDGNDLDLSSIRKFFSSLNLNNSIFKINWPEKDIYNFLNSDIKKKKIIKYKKKFSLLKRQIEEKLNSNNHGEKLPTISPDLESISEMIKILNKNSKNDDHNNNNQNNNNQNNNNQNNNNQNNLPIKPVIKRRTTFINVKVLRQTENEQSVKNDINSNEGNENISENNMHYEDIFHINKKYENQKTLPRIKKKVDILQENEINQNIKDENKNDTGNNNDTNTKNENENENEFLEEEGRVSSHTDVQNWERELLNQNKPEKEMYKQGIVNDNDDVYQDKDYYKQETENILKHKNGEILKKKHQINEKGSDRNYQTKDKNIENDISLPPPLPRRTVLNTVKFEKKNNLLPRFGEQENGVDLNQRITIKINDLLQTRVDTYFEKILLHNEENGITPKRYKQKKAVILLRGRFAGRKAVVIQNWDEANPKGYNFPHCLVVGIDHYPKKINRQMKKRQKARRSTVKPFVKVVNQAHLMPTRYNISLNVSKKKANLKLFGDVSTRSEMKKELKKALTKKYLNGKNKWLFTKLRF